MRLVIENGGTKSDWLIVENDFSYSGSSILFHLSDDGILTQIKSIVPEYSLLDNNLIIDFYTASLDDIIFSRISSIFNKLFESPSINIYSDMLAASRALFKREKGISCILGTGSNCAFYDGKSNHEITFSSGYLFGDMGSAYDIGKQLLIHYFNNTLPSHIIQSLETEFKFDKKLLLSNIYSLPNPKSYIASFSQFIFNYKDDTFINKIIIHSIIEFLNKNPFLFPNYKDCQFGFVGSVSFYFSDIIKSIMNKENIKYQILKKPIHELKKYYL